MVGFLQRYPAASAGAALVGCMNFYGRRFDPAQYGVSVARGALLHRSVTGRQPATWNRVPPHDFLPNLAEIVSSLPDSGPRVSVSTALSETCACLGGATCLRGCRLQLSASMGRSTRNMYTGLPPSGHRVVENWVFVLGIRSIQKALVVQPTICIVFGVSSHHPPGAFVGFVPRVSMCNRQAEVTLTALRR